MVLDTRNKRPSSSLHHKKLKGTHQKQDKSFMKTYWPYLPLFVIAGIVMISLGAWSIGPMGAAFGGVGILIAGATILL